MAANCDDGGIGAVPEGTFVATAAECGAGEGTENAYNLGYVSGKEASAIGCNWMFNPVVDVYKNWRNTIVNTRSFGSEADKSYGGLDKFGSTVCPATVKYDEPNRSNYTHYESGRDVPLFRLAETYLLRAEAYGRKGNYNAAIDDINKVRARAAFKAGETRAEVLARLQPGYEKLTQAEQQWPYEVEKDMTSTMLVDESYWDGGSANSKAEMYPETATTTEDRFVNFILNELARELNQEMVYYENLHHSGWQADRIIYHDQLASPKQGLWDNSDNLINGIGQTGNGMGMFEPYFTFKPFAQTMLDLLTDENGVLLDEAAKKAYQNYGY